MTGWFAIQKLERFRERAQSFGLMIAKPKHNNYSNDQLHDRIALIPCAESLPIFTRDAEIFLGTLEQAEEWLLGYEWAKNYFLMIKATTVQKIQRCEQNIRNQDLITTLSRDHKGTKQI